MLRRILAGLQEKAFLGYLLWKTRPALIRQYLDRLDKKKTKKPIRPATTGDRKVRVAAVQVELRLVEDVREYVKIMYKMVEEAWQQGAQLVAFPEDITLPLIGMLPGINDLSSRGALNEAVETLAGPGVKVADIFNYLSPVTRQVYHTTFSELARRFGAYLMGGSMVVGTAEGKVVNQAWLFNPEGEAVGKQEKAHLLPLEAQWGLSCGDSLRVYSTEVGNVAFPICMDATYFETFRIVAFKGAEIVIIPSANPEEYNFWKALRGIWPRVQESQVYGISSCLVGSIFGYTLTGRSGIFAPIALTPNRDGILAQVEHPDKPGVVVADLDLEALKEERLRHPRLDSINRELCARYLPALYDYFSC
ncbi:nitrilase-related carbon-nitrogen hydrolase [Calderihabitans maritimus]|uniref:Nitrilase/cyanide hydratase and apolipoprotein N-acyltransferase n=1 Tax=Calderihabitans maritimus TaxID=1246530 RepID=A0A1Z5HQT3_9FIRM|nr:nitrilase-related carbon-nitrogen hydrolase [Calderihabitans maritimus]GAW91798.1 Nitrilase/cyanide hydratase and apolipoprotein N-acyltransferase [Calderihabitans maritimus]